MSMAITHFAVGGTLTALVALYLLPPSRYARTLVIFGGVWGMLPDIHWVTPVFAAEIKAAHSSVFANVFWLHETLDVIDPTDSRGVAALALGVFLLTVSLGDYWSYTTQERADSSANMIQPIEPFRSLTVLTRVASAVGIILGVVHLLVGIFHSGIETFQALYLGIGIALVGTGVVGLGGQLAVDNWVTNQVPQLVQQLLSAGLSTGIIIVGGVLLVIPIRSGIEAQSVAFAGLGSLLLVLGLLIAQLRLRTKSHNTGIRTRS